MKKLLLTMGVVGAGFAYATDYTWLANPASASWLGDLNWSTAAGTAAWSAGADDTATFGASSQTTVDVNGAVTVTNLVVGGADYLFTGGPLTVNGPVAVAEGVTATVEGSLSQTSTEGGQRLFKTGKGTLVVKGTNGTENVFQRVGQDAGTLVFDGGHHVIDVQTTSAGYQAMPFYQQNGRLEVTGGARVDVTNGTYCALTGGELFITNGTFNCFNRVTSNQFLNAYGTLNASRATHPGITVSGNGTFVAWRIRPSQQYATTAANCAEINVVTGGTLVVHDFWIEKGQSDPIYARMFFDGGNLVFTNVTGETGSFYRFDTGDLASDKRWQNTTLAIGERGLHLWSRGLSWFKKSFSSGAEKDGGLHLHGNSVPYFDAVNTFNGGLHLYSGFTLATFQDGALGAVPDTPTDSVFFHASDTTFHFGQSYAVNKNRDFLIDTNCVGVIGTQNSNRGTIKSRIHGVEADGRSATLKISDGWNGTTCIETADGRTNQIGKLFVKGRVQFGAGTTLVTSNTAGGIDSACSLYVEGKNSAFDDTKGNLIVTGGLLRVTSNSYVELAKYGQMNIQGGTVDLSDREFLNGLNTPGRTTISGGELICRQCRISQCPTMLDTGLPACSITVSKGGTLKTSLFYIDTKYAAQHGCLNLDGGTVVAQVSRQNFMGDYTTSNYSKVPGDNYGKWTNILVRVCAGGAVIDTAGFEIGVRNPLLGAVSDGVDGGLTKKGAGILTIANTNDFVDVCNTNTYTGVTRVEAGTLQFLRAEGGFPGGDLEFTADGLAQASPLVKMPALAFRADHGLRIADADLLDDRTFGKAKTVVRLTTPLTSVPPVSFVSTNGTTLATANGWRGWTFALAEGGTALTFGPVRGTVLIFR